MENKGDNATNSQTSELRDTLVEVGSKELPMVASNFTSINKHEGEENIREQFDRDVTTKSWLEGNPST